MIHKEFSMLGYKETKETILRCFLEDFHEKIEINFDLKLYEDALDNAGILDIDFYNKENKITRPRHLGSGFPRGNNSFGSITYTKGEIVFNYIDFGHNSSKSYKLFDFDKNWHNINIIIERKNIKCNNKICEFSDCDHQDSSIINDEEINWNSENKKIHKTVNLSVDNSIFSTFYYFASSSKIEIYFGNNDVKSKKISKDYIDNNIYKKHYKKEKSFSIKNVNILVDGKECEVEENFITPFLNEKENYSDQCYYCNNISKYIDTIEHDGIYFMASLCQDHFSMGEPSS